MKRGISNTFKDDINEGLRRGKKPKAIQSALRAKYKDTEAFDSIPGTKSMQNYRYNLIQKKEFDIGMNLLSDVTDFIEKHKVATKESFLEKGVSSNFVFLFSANDVSLTYI